MYNKPERFGVRLYDFNDDYTPKIMAVLSQFQRCARHVIGVSLELLDEDKEVIHTMEEKSYIEFLISGEDRFAIHPTIINSDSENSRIVFTIRNSNRKRLAGLEMLKKQLGLESQSVILPIIQEQSSQGSLTIL